MHGVRKTISHAAIYSVGVVLQNITSLVMLPIYTRYLTPTDYGTISMLQIFIDVANLLFGMELTQAVFRFYSQAETQAAKSTVISSALGFDLVFKAIGVLVLILLADPVAMLLFGDASFSTYVRLFAIALLTNSFFTVPFQYLRALGRPVWFVAASALKLVVQLGLNIVFVIVLEMHVLGVIYSTLLSGLLVGGALVIWTFTSTSMSFSVDLGRKLLRFSFPLIGAGAASVYMTFASRWSLGRFAGLEALGLYVLAIRIVSIIESFVWAPFQQSWGAVRFDIVKQPGGPAIFKRAFSGVSLLLVFASTAAAVFSEEFLKIMSAPAYWSAALIVPLVAMVEIIRQLTTFSRLGLLVHGRTGEFFRATVLSAAIATVVLFFAVPRLGVYGAPIAGLAYVLTQLLWLERPSLAEFEIVKLPWWKLVLMLCVGALAYAISFAAPESILWAVLVKSCILIATMGVLYFAPVLDVSDRKAITDLARRATRHVFARS